jgi:hypothetical protein
MFGRRRNWWYYHPRSRRRCMRFHHRSSRMMPPRSQYCTGQVCRRINVRGGSASGAPCAQAVARSRACTHRCKTRAWCVGRPGTGDSTHQARGRYLPGAARAGRRIRHTAAPRRAGRRRHASENRTLKQAGPAARGRRRRPRPWLTVLAGDMPTGVAGEADREGNRPLTALADYASILPRT